MFRHVTVIFRYGNGSQRQFAVDFGSSFPEDWIPPIPPKDGRRSYWIGLEEADMAGIFFDLVFEQGYTKQTTVLESALARNALPVLFVQGIFSEDALLTGEIVGAILCGSDGRRGCLYHVCVHKDYRRQGIGKTMVIWCMEKLRELQINKVSLIAFTKNDVGNAFWKEIGWTKREDLNYYDFTLNEKNITAFIQ